MSDWPSSTLIRITSGNLRGVPISGALAASAGLTAVGTDFKYQIIHGPGTGHLLRRDDPDSGSILAWEDVVPVSTADLENLSAEFRGAAISERRLSALLKVTSSLKLSAPSPLCRAVDRVEALLERPKTLLDTSPEEYLSLLLGSLATFQGVEHGPRLQAEPVLATIVRICVQWVAEVTSSGSQFTWRNESEVLAEVQSRVESDPAVGGFPAMAALAGDSATWVDEARETAEGRRRLANGLPEPVLTIAHYALALLAKSLEDGE